LPFNFIISVMKKIFLILCGTLCLQIAYPQRSAEYVAPDRLLTEGKTMYEEGNYAGCIAKMYNLQKENVSPALNEEADFYTVASKFYLQRTDPVITELRSFVVKYPTSFRTNEIRFLLGSDYFRYDDFKQSVYWFAQVDLNALPASLQDDYAYRLGIANIETGEYQEAERLLSLLRQNSDTYRQASVYYLAYLRFREGEYDSAEDLFNQVRNEEDFQPDVQYYLTQLGFARGNYQQTIKDGIALLDANHDHKYNDAIRRIIGLSYFETGDYTKTIEYLDPYLAERPYSDPKDYYLLGLAFYYHDNYEKAIYYLNSSNPGDDALGQNIYFVLGQTYLKQRETQKALMSFQSAARMDYDNEVKEAATYNYAMLLHQTSASGFGESVTVLEDFVNTFPNSIYADRVNDALIDVYLTTKNYETALESISKIKNPSDKIRIARQKIYYYLGTLNFSNINYNEAITNFTNAIAEGNYVTQERDEALYWRGESYYKTGDYLRANSDYQAFINTGNKTGNLHLTAIYNMAYCAFNQKLYDVAMRGFIRYTAADTEPSPTLADAYARLGDCYFFERMFPEAETAYNQAVAIAPTKGDYAIYQKGYVLGLQKDYIGKIVQMDNLIADYPESPYLTDAMYEKGRAYVLLDMTNDAIEAYRVLTHRFPESSNARKAGLQIGLLYFNTNQPAAAAAAYKEVVAKYPGSEEARTAVQDLKAVYFDLNDVQGYADYVRSLGGTIKFDVTQQDSLTYLSAERLFLRNETKQAQSGMLAYLNLFPSGAFNVNAHYYLGQTYYLDRDFDAAKPEFQRVLEAGYNQFTEDALLRLADITYNKEEYEQALSLYERLQNTADNKANRATGAIGVVRTAARLGVNNQVVSAANALMRTDAAEPSAIAEARLYRAKAYLALGENGYGENDLSELSKDTRTVFGAEAKYLLAQHYFDRKENEKAKEIVQDYIKQGTPHQYYLARSFILMADIFNAENETLQARQYLESLQSNYKNADDDIKSMIEERLSKM